MVNLRDLQLFELEILREFIRVCNKNNIRYFLGYGTLLGCVRHQGFIPWDDDVDVFMLYPDYVRFQQVADRELKEGFSLFSRQKNPKNYGYWDMVGVENSTSMNMNMNKIHAQHGVGIDIFPLFPFEKANEKKLFKKAHYMMLLALKWYHLGTLSQSKGLEKIKKMAHAILPDSVNMFLFNREIKYLGNQNPNSEYLIDYLEPTHLYRREWFETWEEKKFEDMLCTIPTEWDKLLTEIYGDYMKEPEDKTCTHCGNPDVYISLDEPYTKFLV